MTISVSGELPGVDGRSDGQPGAGDGAPAWQHRRWREGAADPKAVEKTVICWMQVSFGLMLGTELVWRQIRKYCERDDRCSSSHQ